MASSVSTMRCFSCDKDMMEVSGSSSTRQLCYRTTAKRATTDRSRPSGCATTIGRHIPRKGWVPIMGAMITRDLSPSPLSPADGTPTDEDQLSSKDVYVSASGHSRDWWRTSGPTSSAVAPPSDSVHHNAALEPWQPVKGRGRTHVCKQHASIRYYPY